MKKNETLIRTLCKPFCAYYKEGRNEELLCRGAIVVERLISTRTRLPRGEQEPGAPLPEARNTVISRVCRLCGFREHDCDFAQDRNARPCGGFEFLCRLVGAKDISEDDLS